MEEKKNLDVKFLENVGLTPALGEVVARTRFIFHVRGPPFSATSATLQKPYLLAKDSAPPVLSYFSAFTPVPTPTQNLSQRTISQLYLVDV